VLDTLTVAVPASSVIDPASAVAVFSTLAADIVVTDPIAITGAGALTIQNVLAGELTDPMDASGLTGAFTISVSPDNNGAVFDFSDGAAQQALGVDKVILQAGSNGDALDVTADAADNNLAIDIVLDAAETAGAITVAFDNSDVAADDAVTLNLLGDGDGCGAVDVSGIDTLTINSGGTTDNAVGGITMSDQAFVTETIVITGAQNLDAGTLAGGISIIVNASALTGKLTIVGDAVGDQITGGAGDDDITGGADGDILAGGAGADALVGAAGADQLNGGDGDDDLSGGAGVDQVTGGAGVDLFHLNGIVANADRELIQDFVAGAGGDVLGFDAAQADSTVGADVTFATCASGDVDPAAGADDVILRDTAANIAACNTVGGDAVIAIATDNGNIIFDADGDFTAGSVVIGTMTAAQVANLVSANVVIE
jgi:S-layer protein